MYSAQREIADLLKRTTGQCQKILERLTAGPATNVELNKIAFRYSARIHELRKILPNGWTIETGDTDDNGVTRYILKSPAATARGTMLFSLY